MAKEKVTAKALVLNASYIHKNGWGYRTIIRMDPENKVLAYLCDSGDLGMCSYAHFARTCPVVATRKEVDRIDAELRRREKHL